MPAPTTIRSCSTRRVPLYMIAYEIGAFVTGEGNAMPHLTGGVAAKGLADWIPAFIQWLAALGKPLLVGVPLFGLLLAAGSYFLVRALWRLHVLWQWRRRQRKRKSAA